MTQSKAFYNEIDKFACAVLRHHIEKGTLPSGYVDERDIRELKADELRDYNEIHLFAGIGGFPLGFRQAGFPANVRVCTFGFPCQDLSVAGKREGLGGDRSGLFFEAVRIIREFNAGPEKINWIVAENVPGLLSSWSDEEESDEGWWQTNDFDTVIQTLSELGYGLAWAVLDSQWFGVPQRRRRVFIVGCLGDGTRAAKVLSLAESLQGDHPPRREARKGIAAGTARSVAIRGRDGTPQAELGDDKANAIFTPNGGRGGIGVGAVLAEVTHSLRADGFDASEDGTGRGTPIIPILEAGARTGKSTDDIRAGIGIGSDGDPMFTLQSGKQHAVAFNLRLHRFTCLRCGRKYGIDDYERNPTCPNCGSMECDDTEDTWNPEYSTTGSDLTVATADTQASTDKLYSSGRGTRVAENCARGAQREYNTASQPESPIAFQSKASASQSMNPSEVSPTLDIGKSDGVCVAFPAKYSGADGAQGQAVATPINTQLGLRGADTSNSSREGVGVGRPGDPMFTLQSAHEHAVHQGMAVRRLLPVECEKLQAFPPGWTAITYRGKPAADGPRYKSLGNAVSVCVVKWLAERIVRSLD